MSKIITVLGGFFGDEGKGKQAATIAKELSNKKLSYFSILANKKVCGYCVRINGGPNGGHAIHVDGVKVTGHVLPSTVGYENVISVIGSGCAIQVRKLAKEITDFKNANYFKGPLFIDGEALIILEAYEKLDGKRNGFKSTGSGISDVYCHASKRDGIRARDLLNEENLKEKLNSLLPSLYAEFKAVSTQEEYKEFVEKYSIEKVLEELNAEEVKKYISTEIKDELIEAANSDILILAETSQSYFLGLNSGIELGTSSIIDPSWLFTSQKIAPRPQKVIAVVKAFGSRVGDSYFVGEFGDRTKAPRKTELLKYHGLSENVSREEYEPLAIKLMNSSDEQEKGDGFRLYYSEFGETTGRPRGKAPLDLVALRTLYNQIARGTCNEVELWINHFDGLEHLSEIPLILNYIGSDGKKYDKIPNWIDKDLRTLKAEIVKMPSWNNCVGEDFNSWPQEAKDFIKFVEKETNLKIAGVGIGPNNGDIVKIK